MWLFQSMRLREVIVLLVRIMGKLCDLQILMGDGRRASYSHVL